MSFVFRIFYRIAAHSHKSVLIFAFSFVYECGNHICSSFSSSGLRGAQTNAPHALKRGGTLPATRQKQRTPCLVSFVFRIFYRIAAHSHKSVLIFAFSFVYECRDSICATFSSSGLRGAQTNAPHALKRGETLPARSVIIENRIKPIYMRLTFFQYKTFQYNNFLSLT